MAEFPLLPIPTPVPDDPDCFCISVAGVLDQLEDSAPGRATQFVPEELHNASPRPELQAQRCIAGFPSSRGHGSDPLSRSLVEYPFSHPAKVASARREELPQPSIGQQ